MGVAEDERPVISRAIIDATLADGVVDCLIAEKMADRPDLIGISVHEDPAQHPTGISGEIRRGQPPVPEQRGEEPNQLFFPRRFLRPKAVRAMQPDLELCAECSRNTAQGCNFEAIPPGFVAVQGRGAGAGAAGQPLQAQAPRLPQFADLLTNGGGCNIIIHDNIIAWIALPGKLKAIL